jgi:hypothetical protein
LALARGNLDSWGNSGKTMQTELNRLRMALSEMHHRLIEAEAELTDRLAEVNAFEFEF